MSEAVSLAIRQKCARKCADLDSKKVLWIGQKMSLGRR